MLTRWQKAADPSSLTTLQEVTDEKATLRANYEKLHEISASLDELQPVVDALEGVEEERAGAEVGRQ